jgi:uncharacterized protein YggE
MKKFALFLTLIPISLFADGGLPTQPYIYRGDADTGKPPDTVIMRFDLVACAPDQSKANSDVQARAAKIFALLDQRKIARTDVVAQQVRSEADFEQSEGY